VRADGVVGDEPGLEGGLGLLDRLEAVVVLREELKAKRAVEALDLARRRR
jgi:hypothetical protein